MNRWICLFLLLYKSLTGFSQIDSTLITEDFQNISLIEVIQVLQERYDIKFAYEARLLENEIISVTLQTADVQLALEQILQNTGLSYRIKKNNILIIPIQEKERVFGYVRDIETGETLPFASISAVRQDKHTITNHNGYFVFPEIDADSVELKVSYLGYDTQTFKISDIDKVLHIDLYPNLQTLDEVKVTSDRLKTIKSGKNPGQYAMDSKRIDRLPALGTPDVFRSLHLLPGVAVAEEISSELSIRGGGEDENVVLFDGYKVFHLDHFFGLFSTFNPDAIKNIQIHKGGFAAKYGGGISSVVEIKGKSGNRYKPSVSAQINPINTGATLEFPLGKKATFFTSFRSSFADVYESDLYRDLLKITRTISIEQGLNTVIVNDDELAQNLSFYEVNSKISYTPSSKDILSLSLYHANDESLIKSVDGNNTQNPADVDFDASDIAEWSSTGISMTWGKQHNAKQYSNTLISYSLYDNKTNYEEQIFLLGTSASTTQEQKKNRIENILAKWDHQYVMDTNHSLDFGLQVEYVDSSLEDQQISETDIYQNKGIILSSYVQDAFSLNNRLTLTPGLRYTYVENLTEHFLEPRTSLIYNLNDSFHVKASWGKYYQFIRRAPVNRISNKYSWVLVDDNRFPVLSSDHYIAGLAFEKNNFLIDLEFYHKKDKGILDPNIYTSGLNRIETGIRSSNESRETIGIDVLLQYTKGVYTGWMSYTLSDVTSIATLTSIFDPFQESSRVQYDASQDRRHQISITQMLNFSHWNFSANWIYATGKPYSRSELDIDQFVINADRLPAYHRLDVSVGYDIKLRKFSGSMGVNIFNVYDRQNIINRNLDESFDAEEDVLLETSSLGIFPGFYLSIKF